MSKVQDYSHFPYLLLVAALAHEDLEAVDRLACDAGWRVNTVQTSGQALQFARMASVPVVLVDGDTCSGGWRFLLERTLELPRPPWLIVYSRLADESLWAEVLNLGGFDVVRTPFHQRELRTLVRNAWESWEREKQHTSRDLRLAAGHGNLLV